MMETLNAFSGLDPASRSGLIPIRDGAAFREKVMELAQGAPVTQRIGQPFQAVAEHLGSASESARVDPYAFSPPSVEMS